MPVTQPSARAALSLWLIALVACRDDVATSRSAAPAKPAAGPAATLRGESGATIEVWPGMRRWAVLGAGLLETVFAAGCGERVVLRDQYSTYPPAATDLPAVAGFKVPLEVLLQHRPDLVLTSFAETSLIAQLKVHGIPALDFSPAEIPDILSELEQFGRICQPPAVTRARLDRLHSILGEIRRCTAAAPPLTAYYEMDWGVGRKPWTLGPGALGHSLLQMAGLRNVFADAGQRWFQVTSEQIFARDPDLIILGDTDVPDNPQTVAAVRRRPGWSNLKAVQANRIYSVPAPWVSSPGPRVVLALQSLVRQIHPQSCGRLAPAPEPR